MHTILFFFSLASRVIGECINNKYFDCGYLKIGIQQQNLISYLTNFDCKVRILKHQITHFQRIFYVFALR